jgi:uncharacterized protein YjbI with pentapeptide repeats
MPASIVSARHEVAILPPGAWARAVGVVRAVLTGAVLTGAVLTGANLARANLTGAELIDADLTDARWPRKAPVPAGWKLDTSSGRLEAAGTDSGTAEAN